MKTKTAVVLSCLIGVVVSSFAYEHSSAESKADKPALKIGVVSIEKIFQSCKRHEKHKEDLSIDEGKVMAELNKLEKEIEAIEAGLRTLRPESGDYLELDRDVMQKRGSYLSQKRFYERQLELKDRQWIEGFYKDILKATNEIAEQEGLDLVFERSEPDFSVTSADGLLLIIRTYKLLYSSGCSDITDVVIARLDAEK